jgi:hypothetical protein
MPGRLHSQAGSCDPARGTERRRRFGILAEHSGAALTAASHLTSPPPPSSARGQTMVQNRPNDASSHINSCHLKHRLAVVGTIVWPGQIGSALFSIGGFRVKPAIGSIHWPKVQNRKHRVAKSANSPHGKILRSYPLTVCFWALRWPFDLKRGFSTQKPPNSTTANGKHPLAKPKRKHPPAKTAKRWFKSQNSFGPP